MTHSDIFPYASLHKKRILIKSNIKYQKIIKSKQEIAENRGGRCLSETYINNRTNLRWECSKGHKWEAAPPDVKKGRWCAICAGNVKLTIQEMQKIAQERGGFCLSSIYKNTYLKLMWECDKGHKWEAAPINVKINRSWCPVCARQNRKSPDGLDLTPS